MYTQNPDLLALYVGFDALLFRHYPGAGLIRDQGAYDPTIRSWYTAAKTYASSPAGPSFFASLMSHHRPYTPAELQLGVAGIDLLIGTLKSNLERLAVNGSQTSLYRLNGVAIANPTWDLASWSSNASTKNRPFLYSDSSKPVISDTLWNQIVSSGGASSQVYKDPTTLVPYLVVWQMLNLTNGMTGEKPSYVSVAAFPLSEINEPIDIVNSDMNHTFMVYAATSIVCFFFVLGIVIMTVVTLANAAVKPLIQLTNESQRISNNIGNKSLFEGVGSGDTLRREEAN
ncbi:hypothetical protein BC938DRAFT_478078, partial [Jimgerdemannia flammicorona]